MADENVTREQSIAAQFNSVEENLNKAGAIAQLLVANPHDLTEEDTTWAMAAIRDLVYESKSVAGDIRQRIRDVKAAVTQ